VARRAIIRVSNAWIAELLQLPKGFDVAAVHVEPDRGTILVIVASPVLPDTSAPQTLPELTPVYERVTRSEIVLRDLRLPDGESVYEDEL
jgi:hypothetical protein